MNKKQKVNSKKKSNFSPGILVLENKSIFNGIGIGYEGTATGEVCFNTSITGYQEIISDPSYAGQIINLPFPTLVMLEQIIKIMNLKKSGPEV